MAGIFDGEGCVTITLMVGKRRLRPLHVLRCCVTMCSKEAVGLFCAFGGKVRGPIHRKDRQPQFTWRVDSAQAAHFLETLRPFLLVKAQQADLGLEFQRTKIRYRIIPLEELQKREGIRQKIIALNGNKKLRRSVFKFDGAVADRSAAMAEMGTVFKKCLKEGITSPTAVADRLGVTVEQARNYLRGRTPKMWGLS